MGSFFTIFHLDGFIEVDDDLCGVTGKEHEDNGGEKSSHGAVAPVGQQH